MILPAIIVGVVARAAVRYAVGAGARYIAKRGAQEALKKLTRRALSQGQKRLNQEIRRRAKCKNCKKLKDLVNPCEFLRQGNPASKGKFRGGSHAGVKGKPGMEAHHIPASSAYPRGSALTYGRRPAIQMTKADHARTASYGSSSNAGAYQRQQAKLLRQGNYVGALAMDIADIKANFGSKYDEALAEAMAYAACLQKYRKKGRKR